MPSQAREEDAEIQQNFLCVCGAVVEEAWPMLSALECRVGVGRRNFRKEFVSGK